MLESVGEMLVFAIEILGGLVDIGRRAPRVGDRYRVRQPLDVVGHILTASADATAFSTRLPTGTVIHIVTNPAFDQSDVDVCVEGELMNGVVPSVHRVAARSVGYALTIPAKSLETRCKRLRRRPKQSRGVVA
jgi:hypothetical protein